MQLIKTEKGRNGNEKRVKSFVAKCWHLLGPPPITFLAPDEIHFVGKSTTS